MGWTSGLRVLDTAGTAPVETAAAAPNSWGYAHESHELTWVISGGATLILDGARFRVDPERALWIPAGLAHEVRPDPGSLLLPLYIQVAEFGTAKSRVRAISRTPEIEEVGRVLLQPGLTTASERAAKITQLRRCVCTEVPAAGPRYPADPRALGVARSLAAFPASPLSMEQWAQRAMVSARTLQRHFVEETGFTFGQWRTHMRMAAASDLLRAGHAVSYVAVQVGYTNPPAFTTAFGREFGMPPSALHPETVAAR
ncbi:helix-turn-helix transcriptional regulator [Mycetocola saprophilus]|uniref:helix-turn-helix transcriptional regulator n=1 Tax=Mycetocola saprophilus TaxID=76636 RepID=UPI0012DE62CA|nr:AraC family transcriptional regulator [Mycetocola saprophilus]